MTLPSFTHLIRKYRHLLTVQNAGLTVALIIAVSWVWGAVATLQQNYQHQRQVDTNKRQIELMKLQNQNYKFQQAYYRSEEFLELSARAKLGKTAPGEKLIILPSSAGVIDAATPAAEHPVDISEPSNFTKWIDFFFGPASSQP